MDYHSQMEKLYRRMVAPSATELYKAARSENIPAKEARAFIASLFEFNTTAPLPKKPIRNISHPYLWVNTFDLNDFSKWKRYNEGNAWLLLVVEHQSRRVWLRPLKTKEPKEVLAALDPILALYPPDANSRWISDDGSEWLGVVKKRFEELGINRFFSLSGRVWSTSFGDRMGLSFLTFLRRYWLQNPEENNKWLKAAQLWENKRNTEVSAVTGEIPNENFEKRIKAPVLEFPAVLSAPSGTPENPRKFAIGETVLVKDLAEEGKFAKKSLKLNWGKPLKVTEHVGFLFQLEDGNIYTVDELRKIPGGEDSITKESMKIGEMMSRRNWVGLETVDAADLSQPGEVAANTQLATSEKVDSPDSGEVVEDIGTNRKGVAQRDVEIAAKKQVKATAASTRPRRHGSSPSQSHASMRVEPGRTLPKDSKKNIGERGKNPRSKFVKDKELKDEQVRKMVAPNEAKGKKSQNFTRGEPSSTPTFPATPIRFSGIESITGALGEEPKGRLAQLKDKAGQIGHNRTSTRQEAKFRNLQRASLMDLPGMQGLTEDYLPLPKKRLMPKDQKRVPKKKIMK